MTLTLRQIEVFLAVVAARSISGAAGRLRVSQPAVSRTIGEMERGLGLRLFDRTPRGMAPTAAGSALEHHARNLRVELRLAEATLQAMRSGAEGRLAVGMTPAAATGLGPHAALRLARAMPGLRVLLRQEDFAGMLAALDTGDLDIVLAPLGDARARGRFLEHPVFTDRFAILAGVGHPLAGRAALSLPDLAGADWIAPPAGSRPRAVLDVVFRAAGLAAPRPRVEVDSLQAVKVLLRTGGMIALLPHAAAQPELSEGLFVELDVPIAAPPWPIGALLRPAAAGLPAIRAFLGAIREP